MAKSHKKQQETNCRRFSDTQLYYDTQPMFEDAETAWTSWDDKLDSDVMTKIVDEQQQLAQGIIKPDEFIKTCDSLVKK